MKRIDNFFALLMESLMTIGIIGSIIVVVGSMTGCSPLSNEYAITGIELHMPATYEVYRNGELIELIEYNSFEIDTVYFETKNTGSVAITRTFSRISKDTVVFNIVDGRILTSKSFVTPGNL